MAKCEFMAQKVLAATVQFSTADFGRNEWLLNCSAKQALALEWESHSDQIAIEESIYDLKCAHWKLHCRISVECGVALRHATRYLRRAENMQKAYSINGNQSLKVSAYSEIQRE